MAEYTDLRARLVPLATEVVGARDALSELFELEELRTVLEQLRDHVLLTAAAQHSTTDVAAILDVTPSAISQQKATADRRIGQRLQANCSGS